VSSRTSAGHGSGGRLGLGRRGPFVSDLPRRHADYAPAVPVKSVDSAGAAVGQSPPLSYDDLGGNDGGQEHQARNVPLNGISTTRASSSLLASSMRHVLGGAVEDDLPRRRPIKYSPSGGEDAPPVDDGDDVNSQQGDDGAGSDTSVSQRSSKESGGSRSFGLRSRGPIASDLPRRRSGISSSGSTQPVVGADVGVGQSAPFFDERSDNVGTGDAQDHSAHEEEVADASVSAPPKTPRASSSFGESMRQVLGGAVEQDLPRRRSSKYSLPGGEDVPPALDAEANEVGHRDNDDAGLDTSWRDSEGGMSGKGAGEN